MTGLLALTGIVILVSALASGPFERRGISLVLLFLLVGLAAGPYGLGVASYDLSSTRLQLVAVVSLTMVLFSDAVSLRIDEVRKHAILDVRTEDSFASDPRVPEGVLRVNPKYVVAEVKRMGLPKDAYLALYCT